MKPTFFRNIDVDTVNDMHLASEIDFDLTTIVNYIRSLIQTREHNKLVDARSVVDDFINTIYEYEQEVDYTSED